MISFGSIDEIKIADFDEIWLCVNSISSLSINLLESPKVMHVPELAPDNTLFSWYRNRKRRNEWNIESFQQYYVPWLLKSFSENSESKQLLEQLVAESSRKDIYICCFCTEEEICHRSILCGVLYNKGAKVEYCPLQYQKYKLID